MTPDPSGATGGDREREPGLHPLVGHEEPRAYLGEAVRTDRIPAALLIHGPPGIGKQRLALWFARLLTCTGPATATPCGECRSCRLALRLEHPDIHWHFPLSRPKGVSADRLGDALEEARLEALADIRRDALRPPGRDGTPRGYYVAGVRQLRQKAYRRPAMGQRQVFIVAEAGQLVPQESSPEAANALLKLLEEPPEDTNLILTTAEPGRLLPTIRSRTLPLRLVPLSQGEVRGFLEGVVGVKGPAAERAALLGDGSIGRALGFLPQGDDPGPLDVLREEARKLLEASLGGPEERFGLALSYPVSGSRELVELLSMLAEWIRDLAAVVAGAPERIRNVDGRDFLEQMASRASGAASGGGEALAAVEEARVLAQGNVDPRLVISFLLLELERTMNVQESS